MLVDEKQVTKAGTLVSPSAQVRILSKSSSFVSRGGEKIDPAFDYFQIELGGIVALDIGASTGGFTDCMLKRGAEIVYAVDVGHNQLDFRLKESSKVVVMEKTNARTLTPELFDPAPSFASIDVSFISVQKILPAVFACLKRPCQLLILVKPQFELGRDCVSKGGVVRDPEQHKVAVKSVVGFAEDLGLSAFGEFPSPVPGQKKGNREFFVYLGRH